MIRRRSDAGEKPAETGKPSADESRLLDLPLGTAAAGKGEAPESTAADLPSDVTAVTALIEPELKPRPEAPRSTADRKPRPRKKDAAQFLILSMSFFALRIFPSLVL